MKVYQIAECLGASARVPTWLDALVDAALCVECPLFSIFPSSEGFGGILSLAADLRTPVPGGKSFVKVAIWIRSGLLPVQYVCT